MVLKHITATLERGARVSDHDKPTPIYLIPRMTSRADVPAARQKQMYSCLR